MLTSVYYKLNDWGLSQAILTCITYVVEGLLCHKTGQNIAHFCIISPLRTLFMAIFPLLSGSVSN